jgi:hypothetical protein
VALRLCSCGCGKYFDRRGSEKLHDDCRKEKARVANNTRAVSYRDQYKAVKKKKKKIYDNPCIGLKYDDKRERRVPCGNLTGANRFYCHACHARVSDAGMYE